ncbi:MAG TPA: hypothetical protein VFE53_05720, partial [Mucilaginibacter sp.]|nr:hypothetical protein [Mucilaginibacter sp.]
PSGNTSKDSRLTSNRAADTAGCSNFRNKEIATKLVDDNELMNKSREAFLNVFSAPNEAYTTTYGVVLKYYFGTLCNNDKETPYSDKCRANFYFKSNRLTDMEFACE